MNISTSPVVGSSAAVSDGTAAVSAETAAASARTAAEAVETAAAEGDPAASSTPTVYLPPSAVHYIDLSSITNSRTHHLEDGQSNPDDKIIEATPCSKSSRGNRREQKTLKIQAVRVGERWFSLSSTQLDLCRRMERDGTCQRVKIIETPVSQLSTDRRSKLEETLRALNINVEQLQNIKSEAEGSHAADNMPSRAAEEPDQEQDGHASSSVDSGDSSSECDWSEECRSSQDSDTTADLDVERDLEQQQQQL